MLPFFPAVLEASKFSLVREPTASSVLLTIASQALALIAPLELSLKYSRNTLTQSPGPSWPPFAPPFHLQSYIRKALSESGKSEKTTDVSVPCPALPCHQLLERLPLPGLQGLFWLMRSPVTW